MIEPSADDIAAVWSTLNCVTVLDAIGALAKAAFAAEPIEHSADVTKVAIGVDTNVVLRLSDKARTDIVDYLGNRTDAPLIFPARSSKNSGIAGSPPSKRMQEPYGRSSAPYRML